MSNGEVPITPGRLLLADGDGLAYYCSGNDETDPGQARANLINKLKAAQRACGAEEVRILMTSRGSHKGHRYAVARVKPYQGQRTDSRRPKNWEFLRELLDTQALPDFTYETTGIAEADDLFSRYAKGHPDCVIYTQDKDMRMIPGKHLDWLTHILFTLHPGQFRVVHDDKVWGRSWFWSQMLHGDSADNIPGLPFYTDGSIVKSGENKGKLKEIRCGEKSDLVVNVLPKIDSDLGACSVLSAPWASCYGDRWLVEMLEQGILLWMRTDAESDPFDVVKPGNPLHPLTSHQLYPAARAELEARITTAILLNATTQDHGSDSDTAVPAASAAEPMRAMPAAVQHDTSSSRPRPLDGVCERGAAPLVQCAAGEGGEQLPEVRGAEPRRVPSWGARLLAKA